MSDQVIYTVGGTVQAGGGIYISREADGELLRLCRAGEFCYVLTPRQMGKSSLMEATRERLVAEGIRSVKIDLTEMGSKLSGLTAEQWYLGLIDLIVDQLDLDVDYVAWWDERARLGPTQRLSQFLRQVVLEQVSEPVVIFIDEIDSTLNLDFTDDFFAAIRACYNARASDPAFKRLSFVLLGVATPGDLISDPQRTPFNIGQRVDLIDFTGREAIPLAAGLNLPPVEAERILSWILDWTGGHPYLTQRLCAAVAASPTKSWDAAAVDKLVEKTFFGEQSAQDSNFRFVRDMLTQRAPDKAAVLKTYRRILAGQAVPDEERSPAKTHLKLSGIVKREEDKLTVRNEIYCRVFDLDWVKEHTAVNWAPIVAGIAVFVALLAIGSILYNTWVGIQFQDCIANFYQTNAPEEQLAHLARMFRLRGLLGPTDYDYRARELFYGLSREEQLALFSISKVKASDLIVVIRGLYITLADTDGTDSTRPLLGAMVKALGRLDATEETKKLEDEMNSWLEGRELARQNQYADALAGYNKAIVLNGENPATLYERARILTELSEYQQALSDLDQVVAIARLAPAPTPTAPLTIPPTASSTPTIEPTTSPTLTPTSTSTPGTDIAPTETSSSVSATAASAPSPVSTEMQTPTATPTPASIISEFATIGQIISAVRNMISGNTDLASSLASAPSSEYSNLQEFGLIPILTPTPTPTFAQTQVSVAIVPSPNPTQVPISTPTDIVSLTPMASVTFTPLPINTPTSIPMATMTLTPLPINTPTPAPTAASTPVPPPPAPTPTLTPSLVFELDPCAQSNNLTRNCSFDSFARGGVPQAWTRFDEVGSPAFDQSHDTPFDGTSLRIWSDGVPFTSGIYQQVPNVTPGTVYVAAIGWAAASINGEKMEGIERMLGIDPLGGTDSTSPNVAWGPVYSGTSRAPDLSVSAVAQNTTITIFVRVRVPQPHDIDEVFLDTVGLKPSFYPYEIVMISCPEQKKEATWVGGAVLDANSEPVMEGVMVEYRTLSNRGKTPGAEDLKAQPNPWVYDIAKMGKLERRDDWGGNWMNFYFDLWWTNPDMEGRRDTYRDELDATWMHTIVEWWVWVVSPSGEQLSEKANFKTYSHPKYQPGVEEPDPQGGPPQCFVVFKHR